LLTLSKARRIKEKEKINYHHHDEENNERSCLSCLRSAKQEESKKRKKKRLTITTMMKKTTKGSAKSDETGGTDDTRADNGYNTEATGGGFDPDAGFGDVGAQGAPPPPTTTRATAGGFSAGAFGGDLGVSCTTTVTMRAPRPSFGGKMYGMSGSGPPESRTRSIMATTTTNNPSGVAVGGGLTSGMASTLRMKVIEHDIGLCGVSHDSKWSSILISSSGKSLNMLSLLN
jgi:hypothetical protein